MTPQSIQQLWHDFDARDVTLRSIVNERLLVPPQPPASDDYIIASYFFALRSWSLQDAAKEIIE